MEDVLRIESQHFLGCLHGTLCKQGDISRLKQRIRHSSSFTFWWLLHLFYPRWILESRKNMKFSFQPKRKIMKLVAHDVFKAANNSVLLLQNRKFQSIWDDFSYQCRYRAPKCKVCPLCNRTQIRSMCSYRCNHHIDKLYLPYIHLFLSYIKE